MGAEMSIRPARSLADLKSVLEIARLVSEEPVPPASALEHTLASEPGTLFLLACVDDDIAGSGVARESSLAGCLYAMARVLPEFRRQGVGNALYAALSDQARSVGRIDLFGRIRETDEESLRLARSRGFREIGREFPVVLDLRSARAAPLSSPDGVELVSLADRPDLARSAWEVEVEATPDIPTEGEMEAWPFERWRSGVLEGPIALPHASFVAVADGEVVGTAVLLALSDTAAEHGLTAVRRAWRGRGIATALKCAQIEWAKAAGYEELRTANDETNLAMRGINARLGYEAAPAFVQVRGPLAA
jgi:GNAT superfamily N-acetyltransferase